MDVDADLTAATMEIVDLTVAATAAADSLIYYDASLIITSHDGEGLSANISGGRSVLLTDRSPLVLLL